MTDETAELAIDSLVAGGRGLGRVGGQVWLVSGAVPGDRVQARPLRSRPGLVEAEAVEVVAPSPLRRAPPCPIQRSCGGCPWMVLPESEQRTWKARLVGEALRRIGKIGRPPLSPLIASPRSLAYRNRVELTFFRHRDGRRGLGFRGHAGTPVDVDACLLQESSANRVLALARSFWVDGPGRDDPSLWRAGRPGRLLIRRSFSRGELLVGLWTAPGGPARLREFATRLRTEVPETVGVVRLHGTPSGRRGGTRTEVLVGRSWIAERVGGIEFRLPAASFFQVNSVAAERLVERVVDLASPPAGRSVLDLYSGVGLYGLALARLGARVVGCEADAEAVLCARRTASAERIEGARFLRSDTAPFLAERDPVDLVVANPPRTGFGRGVAPGLLRLAPPEIVVVSCDPPTLARDLRALIDGGYALRSVDPLDLFPQTPHVEAIARLVRER